MLNHNFHLELNLKEQRAAKSSSVENQDSHSDGVYISHCIKRAYSIHTKEKATCYRKQWIGYNTHRDTVTAFKSKKYLNKCQNFFKS